MNKTVIATVAALLVSAGAAFAENVSPRNSNHDYQPTTKVYDVQPQIDPITSSSIGTSNRAFPKNSNHDYQPTNVQPQFRR